MHSESEYEQMRRERDQWLRKSIEQAEELQRLSAEIAELKKQLDAAKREAWRAIAEVRLGGAESEEASL